ncbi:MAG: hypothetical protein V7727_19260, partial [Sneathiella sp.]
YFANKNKSNIYADDLTLKIGLYLNEKESQARLITFDLNKKISPRIRLNLAKYSIDRFYLEAGNYQIKIRQRMKIDSPSIRMASFQLVQSRCHGVSIPQATSQSVSISEMTRRRIARMALESSLTPSIRQFYHDIISGKMKLGMSPYEAYLTGGELKYILVAGDKIKKKYFKLFQQNSMHEDQLAQNTSEMVFYNKTQFPKFGLDLVRVMFQYGKITRITRSEGDERAE